MSERVTHILESLRKKWMLLAWTSYGIISLAIGITAGELLHRLTGISYSWIVLITMLSFIFFLLLTSSWRASVREVARYLDAHYPALEESTTLLLSETPAAGSLAYWQQNKTAERLEQEYEKIKFPGKIIQALKILFISVVLCLLAEGIIRLMPSEKINPAQKTAQKAKAVHPLPVVSGMRIQVSAPAYTRVPAKQQEQGDIYAEEGSLIEWEIKTDAPVKNLEFIFNDSAKFSLKPKNAEHTEWVYRSVLRSPGFYQLMIDSTISEQYKMDMIRDGYPEIEVESPKPKTLLEYGMSELIPVKVSLRDDYGIRSAGIFATISSGSGEAVKFTEKQIPFNETFSGGNTHYALQKQIDLTKMGMIPGDEIYFYIRATDNHGQEKKSGIFIVSLADTADLMSTDLAVTGLNVKPEYFRSERQIIIETQQLLADRRTMSAEAFNNKSNDLGIDQKMLRLRYGKFLGEEDETDESGSGKGANLGNPANFGNEAAVMDAYMDKHDNAADATFFEKDTKDQLKATLTEMWKAELQLRIFKPELALPFEYKALRMLKELQQKSRVYVAKAGYKTTPLDFGKRGTGDQDKILSPADSWNTPENSGANTGLREALGILQTLHSNRTPDGHTMEILQVAGGQLRAKAIQEPSKYVNAYGSFQKMFNRIKEGLAAPPGDLVIVEKALQQLISPVAETPYKKMHTGNSELSEDYFRNLKKSSE